MDAACRPDMRTYKYTLCTHTHRARNRKAIRVRKRQKERRGDMRKTKTITKCERSSADKR